MAGNDLAVDTLFAQVASGVLDDGDIDLLRTPDDIPAVSGHDFDKMRANDYPESVKLYALRLWTFEAGRNPRIVSELIKERAELEIPVSTIRRWSLNDGWADSAGRLHQTFSSVSSDTTRHALSALMPVAVDGLRRVLTDPQSSGTAIVRAASLVLGIGGYVPAMQGHIVNLAVNVGRDQLANASDEELAELASSYRPDESHAPDPDIPDAQYRIATHHNISATHRHTHD